MTALDAIYGEVRNDRSISRTAIRQLHQVIVALQSTYRAINQFGQWFDATLPAGAFKTLPNNPTRRRLPRVLPANPCGIGNRQPAQLVRRLLRPA